MSCIEIITSVERRRKYSRSDKERLVLAAGSRAPALRMLSRRLGRSEPFISLAASCIGFAAIGGARGAGVHSDDGRSGGACAGTSIDVRDHDRVRRRRAA